MTEDGAKTKWCPYGALESAVLISGSLNYGALTRDKNIDKGLAVINEQSRQKCIASDCMMWVETNSGIPDGQSVPREKSGRCGLTK